MSESYGEGAQGAAGTGAQQPSGTVETAKQEAAELRNTATEQAGGVMDTAKTEVGAVAHEAKNQVKDLYEQTRSELKEQAAVQQRRVADGLRSVGGELSSMADSSEGGGVAADLVRQVSSRVESVAGWIGDREPGALLGEVKSYARRKPGTFIAVAALAGLVAGRLTRALTEGAADSAASGSGSGGTGGVGAGGLGGGAAATDPDGMAGTTSTGVAQPAVSTPSAIPGAGLPGGQSQSADADIPAAPDGVSGPDLGTVAPGSESGAPGVQTGSDTPVRHQPGAATRDPFGEERP